MPAVHVQCLESPVETWPLAHASSRNAARRRPRKRLNKVKQGDSIYTLNCSHCYSIFHSLACLLCSVQWTQLLDPLRLLDLLPLVQTQSHDSTQDVALADDHCCKPPRSSEAETTSKKASRTRSRGCHQSNTGRSHCWGSFGCELLVGCGPAATSFFQCAR